MHIAEAEAKAEAINKKTCPKSDEINITLKEIWDNSPKKTRERSSKVKVLKAWKKIKASERPDVEQVLDALDAWSRSEKWATGYAEGLHIWISDRQWDNLPEANIGVTQSQSPANPADNYKY